MVLNKDAQPKTKVAVDDKTHIFDRPSDVDAYFSNGHFIVADTVKVLDHLSMQLMIESLNVNNLIISMNRPIPKIDLYLRSCSINYLIIKDNMRLAMLQTSDIKHINLHETIEEMVVTANDVNKINNPDLINELRLIYE